MDLAAPTVQGGQAGVPVARVPRGIGGGLGKLRERPRFDAYLDPSMNDVARAGTWRQDFFHSFPPRFFDLPLAFPPASFMGPHPVGMRARSGSGVPGGAALGRRCWVAPLLLGRTHPRFLIRQVLSAPIICANAAPGSCRMLSAALYPKPSWNSEGIRDHDLYLRRRSPVPPRDPGLWSIPVSLYMMGTWLCTLLGGNMENSRWSGRLVLASGLSESEAHLLLLSVASTGCPVAHD